MGVEHYQSWLQDFSPGFAEDVRRIERVELWTIDGDESPAAAAFSKDAMRLARALMHEPRPDAAEQALFNESDSEKLLEILAYIPLSQMLHLLHLANTHQPGLSDDLLVTAAVLSEQADAPHAEATVHMERVRALIRRHAFARIFGPTRRRDVLELVREMNEQEGFLHE